MKFFHLSDLHIGKRVNGFSMLEDQKVILRQILNLAKKYEPDGILLAGDLYDKTMPSAEAVELADEFLFQFAREGIPVWAISGNHDSPERVAYGSRMMEQSGIHMSRVFDGRLQKHTFTNRDGETADLYLLPFLRPGMVRRFFPDRDLASTQEAVSWILGQEKLACDRPSILLMHQFLAGAKTCESEELQIGGADQVDVRVTEGFDYVALGHLHRPQQVGRENVRYCGSPLKYSFSEADHEKSVTFVELVPDPEAEGEKKWKTQIRLLPLKPRRDLRRLRGPLEELLKPEVFGQGNREDYVQLLLTGREPVLDALGKVRAVYPNVMQIDFCRTGEEGKEEAEEETLPERTPLQLFEAFYEKQNGEGLDQRQRALAAALLNQGEEEEP